MRELETFLALCGIRVNTEYYGCAKLLSTYNNTTDIYNFTTTILCDLRTYRPTGFYGNAMGLLYMTYSNATASTASTDL